MSKTQVYWACQLIGWTLFSVISILIKSFSPDYDFYVEASGRFTIMSFGIAATHAQKLIFQRFSVSELPAFKLAMAIIGGALVTTCVMIFAAFAVLTPVVEYLSQRDVNLFSAEVLTANILAFGMVILIWNALYLGINALLNWQKLSRDKVELEHALREAKLNSLIGQINPHFLFNSLNNIRALILEDTDKARDAIAKLSNLLRQTLTTDLHQTISLNQELETVSNFIEIVKIQLEDRLDYQQHIEVDPDKVLLPPMTVQMLIENAVKHGIGEVRGGGVLSCRIYPSDNDIIIEVSNPGSLSHDSIDKQTNSTGLGVKNIQQRLKLIFGDQACLKLSEANNTVTAQLTIPQHSNSHISSSEHANNPQGKQPS